MIVCWSIKGGSGTSTVAAALAAERALSGTSTDLVDLGGDQAAILGLPDPAVGVESWLELGSAGEAAGLQRLRVPVVPNLRLVGTPRAAAVPERLATEPGTYRRLAAALGGSVVVDAGPARAPDVPAEALSLAVVRPCFLALRRLAATKARVDGVVVVAEPGRVLGRRDVEDLLGAPVLIELPWDANVARAVDAGRLHERLPRSLRRLAAVGEPPASAPEADERVA